MACEQPSAPLASVDDLSAVSRAQQQLAAATGTMPLPPLFSAVAAAGEEARASQPPPPPSSSRRRVVVTARMVLAPSQSALPAAASPNNNEASPPKPAASASRPVLHHRRSRSDVTRGSPAPLSPLLLADRAAGAAGATDTGTAPRAAAGAPTTSPRNGEEEAAFPRPSLTRLRSHSQDLGSRPVLNLARSVGPPRPTDRTASAAAAAAAVVPATPPPANSVVYLQRGGAWKKRYVRVREGELWLGASDDEKKAGSGKTIDLCCVDVVERKEAYSAVAGSSRSARDNVLLLVCRAATAKKRRKAKRPQIVVLATPTRAEAARLEVFLRSFMAAPRGGS